MKNVPQANYELQPEYSFSWLFIVLFSFVGIQILVFDISLSSYLNQINQTISSQNEKDALATVASNGDTFTYQILLSGFVSIGLIGVALKSCNLGLIDYFGLKKKNYSVLILLGIIIAIVVSCIDVALIHFLSPKFGHPNDLDFQIAIYNSASNKPLYWLAVIMVAPLFEELFFRGLMFRVLLNTRLKATGTIQLTSIFWISLHSQYEYYYLAIMMLSGLIFGYSRHKTGSIIVPLVAHMCCNLIVTSSLHFH